MLEKNEVIKDIKKLKMYFIKKKFTLKDFTSDKTNFLNLRKQTKNSKKLNKNLRFT